MKKAFTIRVSGKVQGVFFRASTREKADEFAIKGFVRNEPDGSVYIEAEGEENDLNKFIAWCKRGPIRAKVDRCDVVEIQEKGFTTFEIKR